MSRTLSLTVPLTFPCALRRNRGARATDPLVLIGSRFMFDTTFSMGGTYGENTIHFAEHAIYTDRLLPCHRSAISGRTRMLPAEGEDVQLEGDAITRYEVISVGTESDPTQCRLRQLPWERNAQGSGQERWYSLGEGAGGHVSWISCQQRFVSVLVEHRALRSRRT